MSTGTMTSINILPARSLAVHTEQLLPSVRHPVPRTLVWTNMDRYNAPFHVAHMHDIYKERTCILDAVHLCKLPEGSTVCGNNFLIQCGSGTVVEQIGMHLRVDHDAVAAAIASGGRIDRPIETILADPPHARCIEHVGGDTLLVARAGEGTWGHWIVEILPRAVLAERAYPSRFRFAVTASVVRESKTRGVWRSILESLAAYGIGDHRLVPLERDRDYAFDALWTVTATWMDRAPHPGAMDALREARVEGSSTDRRVAVLRPGEQRRLLVNQSKVSEALAEQGYHLVDVATLPFAQQVATFREAQYVVGALGSGLTNLVYSLSGVRVASLAPPKFGDSFFFGLIQERHGTYVDIRGPVVEMHPQFPGRDDSYTIDLGELEEALAALVAE